MGNIHPGFVLIITGVLALFLPEKTRRAICIAGPIISLISMILISANSSFTYEVTSNFTMNLMKIDPLSKAFGLIFCVISLIAGIYSIDANDKGDKAASLIYAGASVSVVFAGDWITLISFWEIMAVSSTYIVWAGRTHKSRRASFRYLVMHLFGGQMLLAGAIIICLGGNFDITSLNDIGNYGYWLIFIGVAVNGAIPPLHTWAADAYPEASVSGTVYLGSFTTKVAIYALIRLFAGTPWLVVVGAIMAVFAACMALLENDLRRLLSYHIVSQLGMMIAGLATGLAAGIDGATLHAAFNILYKGVLLMGAGVVFASTGKRKISELGGLYRKMPVVAMCFFIASLAIAGFPFLNGFASKALIMESLKEGGYSFSYWMVTAAGVGTWLSITLKINYFVFFGKTDKNVECKPVPIYMVTAMIIGTVLCILTGVFPSLCYELMPNSTIINPFTTEHILEYVGMFIGATVPFVVFIKKMAPHDKLSLDFDWFYRRPLPIFVFAISKTVYKIFEFFDERTKKYTLIFKIFIHKPRTIYGAPGDNRAARPIGDFVDVFVIVLIVVFVLMMITK